MSVFIFGDSFFEEVRWNTNSWPVKLSNDIDVINYASSGSSNHDIYLSFMNAVPSLKEDDIVVVGWTEPNRFYCSDRRRVPNVQNTYQSYLHNETLQNLYYRTYMAEVERICEENKVHLLVMWAFPSGYNIPMQNPIWNLKQVGELSADKYNYIKNFKNEIRPALIYFSWADLDITLPESELVNEFSNDNRPNHIDNQKVHDEIVKVITEFVESKNIGTVDLIKRLENG